MVVSIVMQQIHRIENVLAIELTEPQLDVIVSNILNDFWYFKIADFNLIIKRLSYVKQYGKPQVGDIMSEIVKYNTERMDVGEVVGDVQIKEDEAERQRINAQVLKTYEKLKRDAKIPVKTQKQKDADAKAELAKKIEELQKLYPKTI